MKQDEPNGKTSTEMLEQKLSNKWTTVGQCRAPINLIKSF